MLSYLGLFSWLRPSSYLASKIVMPLSQILLFTFLGSFAHGSSSASFYIIGNAIQMTAVSGIYGVTMSIANDRWFGTLPYLFGTPANRLVMFFGRAFMHVIDGIIGVVIGFLWGWAVLGLNLSQANLPVLGLTVLITTVSTSGLGLLMGCVGLITRNVMFVNNAAYFALLILSGANIPNGSLPVVLRWIADFLPLTHGIRAARALIDGAAIASVYPLLLLELAVGVGYMILGYLLFSRIERRAKRQGTLETV